MFPLTVRNVGSVQDGYSAQITGVTGAVTASLMADDGTAVQTIPVFQVPGQSLAQLNLSVMPTAASGGAVTVTITSMNDPTIIAISTATLTSAVIPPALPPNATAVTGLTIPVHRLATLDARASTDPNVPPLPLTFAWTLTSAPLGSTVTTASIALPSSVLAAFRPDVLGAYVFSVNVSNGQAAAQATVTLQAADLPPVAITNASLNVQTGNFAFLDGANSYDPDGQPITFA